MTPESLKSNLGPFVRIALRYGVGYFAGAEIGKQLAMDPTIVAAVSMIAAAVIEWFYMRARKGGGAT